MLFPLFASKVKYYKNGIWWWSKLINKAIGEERYDYLRIERRIMQNRIWYTRQAFLFKCWTDYPEISYLLGSYPKGDASHGFPHQNPYEVFRDFTENTSNSEGWFAMVVVIVCAAFGIWTIYCYFLPWYWVNARPVRNGEEEMLRMIDSMSSAVNEEIWGNQFAEVFLTPHAFHQARNRLTQGYRHPDCIRTSHMTTFNRKHKFREHYMKRVGDGTSMLLPI